LPLTVRVQLVGLMDCWQLCQLALSVVLPLRPEEAAGLLIRDVKFCKGWLEIGTRMAGDDFTKAQTSFKLPFPVELTSILQKCIGDRSEGPLLQSRQAFEGKRRKVVKVASYEELTRLYEGKLARASRDSVATPQDRKRVFRGLLKELGGVAEDQMARECKLLLKRLGVADATLYTLRGSVTTAMERANIPHLELRYLTGHSTNDILNHYVSLNPIDAIKPYFDAIRLLLNAITERARELGVLYHDEPPRLLPFKPVAKEAAGMDASV